MPIISTNIDSSDMAEMQKQFNESKARELVLTTKKIKEEADDFEKLWLAAGLKLSNPSVKEKKKP